MATKKTPVPFQPGQDGADLWDAHGRNPKAITFGPLTGKLGGKQVDIYLGDARIGFIDQVTEGENVSRVGGNARYRQTVATYEVNLFGDNGDSGKVHPEAWRTRARVWIANRLSELVEKKGLRHVDHDQKPRPPDRAGAQWSMARPLVAPAQGHAPVDADHGRGGRRLRS